MQDLPSQDALHGHAVRDESRGLSRELGPLVTAALIYGVGQGLTRILTVLLLPLFTAYLSPSDYGVIGLLVLVSLVVTPVCSLGLGAAIGACYLDGRPAERRAATIWSAAAILTASCLAVVVIAVAGAGQISVWAFYSPDFAGLVRLSLLTAGLSLILIPFTAYLQLERRAKMFVTLTAASTLLTMGLSVWLVIVRGRGVSGYVEAAFVSQLVMLPFFVAPAYRALPARWDRSAARELLVLGIPLVPGFALLVVLQQGNRYVLQWFDGLGAVGVYTVGLNLGVALGVAVTGFTTAWMPYFMSFVERRDEARILFGRILSYYVISFGALSLLFFIAARPLVLLLTAPAFHDAWRVVGLCATAQMLTGAFSILLTGVYFEKEVWAVTLVQAVAAVLSIALDFLLIWQFGVVGAALALAGSGLLLVGLQYAWNWFRRPRYLHPAYEWGRMAWFAIGFSIWAAVLSLPRSFPLWTEVGLSLAALPALAASVYAGIRPSERRALGDAIRRLHARGPAAARPAA